MAMKPVIYRNIFTNDRVVCKNTKNIKLIEGIEYIEVEPVSDHKRRSFLMRLDSLVKVKAKDLV